MNSEKFDKLQKMYENGLLTKTELKKAREKLIGELLEKNETVETKNQTGTTPKKKSHKLRDTILIIIGMFFTICLVVGIISETKDEIESITVEENDSEYSIGKWIKYSDKETIKILKVEKVTYLSILDNKIVAPDGTYYLILKMLSKNISDRPIKTYGKQKVIIISPTGRKYYIHEESTLALNADNLLDILTGEFGEYLDDGDTAELKCCFNISSKEIKEPGWKILIDGKIEIPFEL